MIDARESIYRPFWAGASSGVALESQNYFSPKKAIDLQYGWMNPERAERPATSIGNKFHNSETFGTDVLNLSAPYKERQYQPGPALTVAPPSYQTPKVYYSGPLGWLKAIFAGIKNIVLKILAKLGLYTPPYVPPTDVPDYTAQISTDSPTVGTVKDMLTTTQDAFSPATTSDIIAQGTDNRGFIQAYSRPLRYESPFNTHTVIFSREVVP